MIKFRWETQFQKTEIGEIPREWGVKKIKDLDSRKDVVKTGPFGSLLHASDYAKEGEEGIPLLLVKNFDHGKIINTEMPRVKIRKYRELTPFYLEEGDIVFSRVGEIGRTFYVTEKEIGWLFSGQTLRIRIKNPKVNTKYIDYFFQTPQAKEISENSALGSTRLSINTEILENRIVPLPPPDEQARIAAVLSWFDDLIENKKRQNEILEKTAMAIFKSWFVDFEPFQDEEFVYSEELGREVPRGWAVRPIGKLCNMNNGISYTGKEKHAEYVEGSYIFITLNNAVEGGGFKPVYAWIKSSRIKERHYVKEGDLIIPNTEQTKDERLIGSPGIVYFPPEYPLSKGVFSHHITRIVPKDKFLTYFLYLYLKFTREESASYATGTGVLGMDIKNFKRNKLVLLPPEPVLQRFHEMVEPLFRKIINNEKEIMVLKKARDTLLPLLVFGKLRVEVIE